MKCIESKCINNNFGECICKTITLCQIIHQNKNFIDKKRRTIIFLNEIKE